MGTVHICKKSDVKDMYYDNRTIVTTKEVTVNGVVGTWKYIKVADTIDFDINKVTHMSRYGNDGLYFTNTEVFLERYDEDVVDISVYFDDGGWAYCIATYLPTQKAADIWFGDSYNNPFSPGLYMYMDIDEGDPCSVAYSFTYETGDFRAIDQKYLPETPLATVSKAGAVHPWINEEHGQDVWMHPETGALFTYENTYTLPVASYYTLGGVKPVAKTSSMTSNVGVDANGRLYSESSYVLPVATSTTLGGVKPIAKTDIMTQEVGVDSTGKLYAMPSAQADWEEDDESSAAYIKNKPIGAMPDWSQLDDTATNYIKNKPIVGEDYVVLKDANGTTDYAITISNGTMVLAALNKIDHMEILSMPEKLDYFIGDEVDLTGISVKVVYEDATEEETTNVYPNIEYVKKSTSEIKVIYKGDYGQYAVEIIPITVHETDPASIFMDFEYIDNGDGTYTATAWKGTYMGEPSSEMIIPDNLLVVL
jgi:hypothetical protein